MVAIPRDRVDENDGRQNARMGGMDVVLTEGSRTATIYGLTMVHERHGNRYEVDDAFLAPLHEVGVDFVGFSADGNYPEVFEIPAHPFYIGTIYHPEFLSRPNKAHPLFAAFIGAAAAHQA